MTIRCCANASQNGAVVGVLTGIGRSKVVMSCQSPCEDERRLLGQDAAVAGHEGAVAVGDLGRARAAHDLAGGIADVVHSARQSRLAETELAAGGVEREVAAEGEVVAGDELHALALLAEAGVLQRQQHGDGVAVIDRHHVHLLAAQIGHGEGGIGGRRDRGVQKILGVGRSLERHVFAESLDPHRTVARPFGEVGIGDDDGGTPDAGHHDLQHVQRVGDDRAGQDVVDGERLVLPDRAFGVVGVDPLVDDDLGHRPLVVAVDRRVALGHLPVGAVLAEVAVRESRIRLAENRIGCSTNRRTSRRPWTPGLLLGRRRDVSGGQCAQDRVADAEFDRRGRPPDHGRGAGSPEIHMFGESRSYAQVFGDRRGYEDLRLGQVRRHDAVDDVARQSRVLERGRGQFGPLFDDERRGRGLVEPLGRKLDVSDDRGFST